MPDVLKHNLTDNTSELQNDVNLYIELEKKRKLKSISARGLASYKSEQYIDKAKGIMSGSGLSNTNEA